MLLKKLHLITVFSIVAIMLAASSSLNAAAQESMPLLSPGSLAIQAVAGASSSSSRNLFVSAGRQEIMAKIMAAATPRPKSKKRSQKNTSELTSNEPIKRPKTVKKSYYKDRKSKGPYFCSDSQCGEKFYAPGSKTYHESDYHSKRLNYSCALCSYSTDEPTTLPFHYKRADQKHRDYYEKESLARKIPADVVHRLSASSSLSLSGFSMVSLPASPPRGAPAVACVLDGAIPVEAHVIRSAASSTSSSSSSSTASSASSSSVASTSSLALNRVSVGSTTPLLPGGIGSSDERSLLLPISPGSMALFTHNGEFVGLDIPEEIQYPVLPASSSSSSSSSALAMSSATSTTSLCATTPLDVVASSSSSSTEAIPLSPSGQLFIDYDSLDEESLTPQAGASALSSSSNQLTSPSGLLADFNTACSVETAPLSTSSSSSASSPLSFAARVREAAHIAMVGSDSSASSVSSEGHAAFLADAEPLRSSPSTYAGSLSSSSSIVPALYAHKKNKEMHQGSEKSPRSKKMHDCQADERCRQQFETHQHRRYHEENNHLIKNRFECGACSFSAKRWYDLQRHRDYLAGDEHRKGSGPSLASSSTPSSEERKALAALVVNTQGQKPVGLQSIASHTSSSSASSPRASSINVLLPSIGTVSRSGIATAIYVLK